MIAFLQKALHAFYANPITGHPVAMEEELWRMGMGMR
jgi:hypothetical protein